jgi:hypothetical protein
MMAQLRAIILLLWGIVQCEGLCRDHGAARDSKSKCSKLMSVQPIQTQVQTILKNLNAGLGISGRSCDYEEVMGRT